VLLVSYGENEREREKVSRGEHLFDDTMSERRRQKEKKKKVSQVL
jgi:hypothetical protein